MKDKKINPFFFFPLDKIKKTFLPFWSTRSCFLNMLIFVILLKMRVAFNVKYSSEAL